MMSLVFGVHPLLFLYSFFFCRDPKHETHKKDKKKREEFLFSFGSLCVFWRLNFTPLKEETFARLSERRQPTPRERERERYKEDAI